MPYVPTRLENCTLMAASYGIEYRWPLWDARLVQQYLSTPSIEKHGPRGIGRYLHRRAISGTVPERVAWKPAKDMGNNRVADAAGEKNAANLVPDFRRNEANMHPALVELIDRDKWRKQIDRFEKGGVSKRFGITTRQTAKAIRWLSIWLHGDA